MNAPNCRSFLDGRVRLYAADCREILRDMQENSIDSCVTDPPYHLTSIVKRFGKPGSAPVRLNGVDQDASNDLKAAYARQSAGFMGKQWDGGDIAFTPELWREVFRVLKPGAHLVAFGGTRTYHRMVCAIEDAGFEIRDQIGWCFGSGFPKSHDISKAIDKHGGQQVGWFGPWLKAWRTAKGIAQQDIAKLFPSRTGGKTGCVANWELGFNLPTPEQFNLICHTFGLPFKTLEDAEREIVGQKDGTLLAVAPGQDNDRSQTSIDVTAPATAAARRWEGWGTALKPAWESICLARKPLSEATVAANVLRWGTGALNIDGCRITADDAQGSEYVVKRLKPGATLNKTGGNWRPEEGGIEYRGDMKPGRWPANLCHDGSEEVLAAFPYSKCGDNAVKRASGSNRDGNQGGAYGAENRPAGTPMPCYGDEGSAARFFYTAKADADDRLGSKHPTVKPVDLMQWLCRLITPPKGTILDPFAGTGTTGEAAFYEGFNAILIEREAKYCADIERRMKLCLASPDERQRESIKARGLVDENPGPLFAESWDEMWKRPFDWKKFREDAAE